ncbi:MAG: tetratricopeptide repeat protein [Candidatus Hodarchaeota archaeon]
MEQNFLLIKGNLSKEHLDVQETNKDVDEQEKGRLNNFIIDRIPKYAFDHSDSARSILLEDTKGYYFIKIFYKEEGLKFILFNIEGKLFSGEEIKKISVKFSQYLDINLDIDTLSVKIHEILMNIESYDFSRSIRSKFTNILTYSKHDLSLRVEEIMPKVTKGRYAEGLIDVLEFYKYQILLEFQKRRHDASPKEMPEITDNFIAKLEGFVPAEISIQDLGTIFYNIAILIKNVGYYQESIKLFMKAGYIFSELELQNLEVFSFFNVIINFKELKNFDQALKLVDDIKDKVQDSITLALGFKGIFFRHVGELYQQLKNNSEAIRYYNTSLGFFEESKQVNIDTAICYLALGSLHFTKGNYFEASKYFSFGANIFNFLNQDVAGISKNMGISYFNLSHEYYRTIKVLRIEKDFNRMLELSITGLSYFFLSNYYVGSELVDRSLELCDSYMDELKGVMEELEEEENQELEKNISGILESFRSKLATAQGDAKVLKDISKESYETIREFQPLKTYYFLVIYKSNGLAIFSKTSQSFKGSSFDEDLIAGMITGIDSFLGEVLSGQEQLSLIDRDNIKMIFEHTPYLLGILFANRGNPKVRHEMKEILQTIEQRAGEKLPDWSGSLSIFGDLNALSKTIID